MKNVTLTLKRPPVPFECHVLFEWFQRRKMQTYILFSTFYLVG